MNSPARVLGRQFYALTTMMYCTYKQKSSATFEEANRAINSTVSLIWPAVIKFYTSISLIFLSFLWKEDGYKFSVWSWYMLVRYMTVTKSAVRLLLLHTSRTAIFPDTLTLWSVAWANTLAVIKTVFWYFLQDSSVRPLYRIYDLFSFIWAMDVKHRIFP